eukprot:1806444-Amphidinium_carterae.1
MTHDVFFSLCQDPGSTHAMAKANDKQIPGMPTSTFYSKERGENDPECKHGIRNATQVRTVVACFYYSFGYRR